MHYASPISDSPARVDATDASEGLKGLETCSSSSTYDPLFPVILFYCLACHTANKVLSCCTFDPTYRRAARLATPLTGSLRDMMVCDSAFCPGGAEVQLCGTFFRNTTKLFRSAQKCPKPGGIVFLGSQGS